MAAAGIFTPLKGAAMGLATATTQTINAGILVWVLHKRLGKIGLMEIVRSIIRTATATALMAYAIHASFVYVSPRMPLSGNIQAVASIVLAIIAGTGAFGLAAIILVVLSREEFEK